VRPGWGNTISPSTYYPLKILLATFQIPLFPARAVVDSQTDFTPTRARFRLKVIPRDEHTISRKNISDSALKVMSRLRNQGFQAYLVGGAVRDLLLGGHPKDFDVATDATPEEVNGVFRNSRIIGRRFRIVHVRFGREIIEVTTFRGSHDSEDTHTHDKSPHSRQSDKGLLLRDNVFGTLEEDAIRRDLTVNALYYDSGTFEVYDHVHGVADLKRHNICIIGDPAQRYREDPVRMLRVVRFAAKLDFSIEDQTQNAIPACASLLAEIPAARLFDEFLKLFMAGYAERTLELLLEFDLLQYLAPGSNKRLRRDAQARRLVQAAMRNTDTRILDGKPVTPAFILAALLWPAVRVKVEQHRAHGQPQQVAINHAGQEVISEAVQTLSIPKRFSMPMREIWEFQSRLERTQGRRAAELVDHRRFRAAYDFLLLREEAGEDTGDLGDFWTDFQTLTLEERISKAGAGEPNQRKRRPRKRRPPASS
jgi:poly(A) polymerase